GGAQSRRSARIEGKVSDASGAVIPGARVTVTNESSASRPVVTDEDGEYSLTLSGGAYKLCVEGPGVQIALPDQVSIKLSERSTVDVRLAENAADQRGDTTARKDTQYYAVAATKAVWSTLGSPDLLTAARVGVMGESALVPLHAGLHPAQTTETRR